VIQKAVLPPNLDLICGERIVDLDILASLTTKFAMTTKLFIVMATRHPISLSILDGMAGKIPAPTLA
jgi:hypothetical protein